MERIGRSHALRRALNCSSYYSKTNSTLPRLTTATRPFSSSVNPLQNESDNGNNNTFTIRRQAVDGPRGQSSEPRSPRPRAVDARSLAADGAGQGTVIRAPRLQLRRSLGRGKTGATGRPIGGRRPSGLRTGAGAGAKGAKGAKRVRRKQSDDAEGDEARDADLESVYSEIRNQARPKAVRYTPVQYDAAALKDTWPSLPVGKTTSTGSAVLEQMSLMSRRFANGYVPPRELANRLFRGERVLFASEEEKAEAMEEVRKLAQARADKMSQRKGTLVEPQDSSLVPISEDDRKALVGQLVRGNYENWQQGDVRHPILDEVQRQLYNNETYRITGKQSEFMTKFQSLLASSQRAKRA